MGVNILFCLCVLLHCNIPASSYSGKLLYSTHSLILEFDFDTRNVTILLELGINSVFDMDYDYKNRIIYFPGYHTQDIVRFAYPSENITLQTVVQTGSFSSGIAVDSTTDHIYWHASSILVRCNPDGSSVTVLTSLLNPWAILLDLTNRWLYIVERSDGLLKSRFDVAARQTIVNFTSTPVYCMDIDTKEQRLYWIDSDGDMKAAEDDGSDIKTIRSTHDQRDCTDFDVFGIYIYYTHNNQLLMVSKTPGSMSSVLYNDTNRISSILVVIQTDLLDL